MPDIYSVSSVPTKAGKKETAVKGVNANFVLQQVLKQLNAEARKEIILRCDELPMLQGKEEEIQTLFSSLLQMIFIKKDSVPQLFLHIHCKNGLEEPLLAGGWKLYTIQFNTNIAPCANWMQEHSHEFKTMAALVQKHNGSLEIAEAQGCIFSLSLPGKLL
jgi:hypothetical protein